MLFLATGMNFPNWPSHPYLMNIMSLSVKRDVPTVSALGRVVRVISAVVMR